MLLKGSWSVILILDHMHQRMHKNLPDETELPNGQKFDLLSLALLGVPSMAEKFLEISENLKQLCFDSADYACLKFILLLNAGAVQNNKQHVQRAGSRAFAGTLPDLLSQHPREVQPAVSPNPQTEVDVPTRRGLPVFETPAGERPPPRHPPF